MPNDKPPAPREYKGVMVSSTFTDLVEHRAVFVEAINGLGLKPVVMENDNFAKPADVIQSSLQMVKDSSAYALVISHKYGQTPDCSERNPDGLSLTELEFNEARRLGRPVLLFIMGEDHTVKPGHVEKDAEKIKKLAAFRENAKRIAADSSVERIYKVFNGLHEFAVAATKSVAELRLLLDKAQESDGSRRPPTSEVLKSKIKEASRARRKHDEENAIRLWDEVRKQAETERNKAEEIGAQVQISVLHLQSGGPSDDIFSTLNKCIQDAKSVDLGEDRPNLLQVLGEAHRFRGDLDQARGFFSSALEHSRSFGWKLQEGYALLALSALEETRLARRAVSEVGLELIQKAYDCFSSVYASGDHDKQRSAKHGFADCHTYRAAIFDHLRLDDALTEYARALDVFRELGEDYEWDLAHVLFERGDLHSRADDAQLAGKDLVAAGELFKKLGDRLMEAKSVMAIAELLDQRGYRRESMQYYEPAVAIAMQLKNPERAAGIMFRYACKLWEMRDYERGKPIFMTLLAADWLRPGQRLDILKMLCLGARATGQKEELELHLKAALDIIDGQLAKATSPDERRRLIMSKGQALEDLDEHDRAIACLRRGLQSFEAAKDRQGVIDCWASIACALGRTKKPKEERQAHEKVLSLIGDEPDTIQRPITLAMLAQLDIAEKRFDDARERLDQAEKEAESPLNPPVLFIVQDLRSKLPPA